MMKFELFLCITIIFLFLVLPIVMADTTPPTYGNDTDDAGSWVYEGTIVNVSVSWSDDTGLSTGIFRTNKTGTWKNETYKSLSGAFDWFNTTINTTGLGGLTICWNEWANDTSDNWNNSMPEDAHCFDVVKVGKLIVSWYPTSDVNSEDCIPGSMCPIEQQNLFGMDTNITCVNGTCGDVQVEARYGNDSSNMTLIPTIVGTEPFYIVAGKFPDTREISPQGDTVYSISHDDNYTFIGSIDKYVYVINKTDFSTVTSLSTKGDVYAVDNDANYLFAGTQGNIVFSGYVYVYNKTDWSEVTHFQPEGRGSLIQSLTNDDNFLYVGYNSPGGTVDVINKTDWSKTTTITEGSGVIYSLKNDANYLYIGSSDDNVYVINKTDWSLVTTLTYASSEVRAVDIDDNYLYIGAYTSDNKTYVVNKTDWSLVTNVTYATSGVSALSNDEGFLYVGSADNTTYVVKKGNWTSEINLTFQDTEVFALDNDVKYLYISQGTGRDSIVYAQRKSAWKPEKVLKYATDSVNALTNDDSYLYIGSADSKTYVVKKSDWSSVANLTYATSDVNSLTQDINYLYIGSADYNVYVVDKSDWSKVTTLSDATDSVNAVDNDANYLYIGSSDDNVYVINKTDWSLVTTLSDATGAVTSLTNDNNYLYIGSSDSHVYVINKTDWSKTTTLTPSLLDAINALDNDEDYLFVAVNNGDVYVINKADWSTAETLSIGSRGDKPLSLSNDRNDLYVGDKDYDTYVYRKADWGIAAEIAFATGAINALTNDAGYLYIGAASPDDQVYVVTKELTNPMDLGILDENATAVMKWLVRATGPLGSEWMLDNRYVSDISTAVPNATQPAWVRISILTPFNFTAKNESMQLYEDTNATIIDFNGNKVAFQTLNSSNPVLSTDLWYDFNYEIIQTSPISSLNSSFQAKFYNYIIDFNSSLTPQLVENYTNSVPDRSTIYIVYAVNSSDIINVSNVTLYYPKPVDEITGVFYCSAWNFTAANCSSWEINHTAQYGAEENSTHIWFNVSNFSAYGAGNQEPLPNITQIKIYDVSNTTNPKTGGTLLISGLNSTFNISLYGEGNYRVEVTIEDEGTLPWRIEGQDAVFQQGLNSSWSIPSNDIWYNVSSGQYTGGNFTNGNVTWNTSLGGSLNSSLLGEKGFFNYLVNISVPTLDWEITDFPDIPNNTAVAQNHTFMLNVTLKCNSADCGSVNGTARYNATGTSANTPINTTSDAKPLYLMNGTNEQSCPNNPLTQGETCTLVWDNINATGDLDTYWNLDVLFKSNATTLQTYNIYTKALDASANTSSDDYSTLNIGSTPTIDADDHLIIITYPAVHVILKFNTIDFGTLDPGTQNSSAIGNDNLLYNISIPTYSSTIQDMWVNGTNLTGPSGYYIPVYNISWSLTNNITTETPLTKDYTHVASNIEPGSTIPTYYWIDVPYGKLQGEYNGTICYMVNTTE